MTILEAIQEANSEADVRSFRFANMSEFNKYLESFQFEDYPCHVVAPFEVRQEWETNRIHQTVSMIGWVVKRIDQDTTDFKSAEIEAEFIQPMRDLAKKIIRKMIESDITDQEAEKITVTIKSEYGLLSANVFGVSYTFEWPVLEGIC